MRDEGRYEPEEPRGFGEAHLQEEALAIALDGCRRQAYLAEIGRR
jgi:hypothetical protein